MNQEMNDVRGEPCEDRNAEASRGRESQVQKALR